VVESGASCPSIRINVAIVRDPHCGQRSAYATAVGSIRSADGVGHGPFAGLPSRSRCCQRL